MNNKNIKTIKKEARGYPSALREISDPPRIINIIGDIEKFAAAPKVAIVGTRRATRYGLETAFNLAQELSNLGIVVISGLAWGIDTAAHRGALAAVELCSTKAAPTWAVIGSGLLNIQPTQNRGLAEKIVFGGGALISEFDHTHPADKWTFPQRNRIVAGLASAVVVVEAPEKSGALITADLATQYNRDVGAVPGEISSINSRGTNELIKNGAAVIRHAQDVLELLGISSPVSKLDNLDNLEQNILRCLEMPMDKERLMSSVNCGVQELNRKLTNLELMGLIKNQAGEFQKI